VDEDDREALPLLHVVDLVRTDLSERQGDSLRRTMNPDSEARE
jgi:hypothetical protein